MPIEMPVFIGMRLAMWHRLRSSLTFYELMAKLRRRITKPLFLWYRNGLALAFSVRNLLTRNAPVKISVGDVQFFLEPAGAIAFHAWSGLRLEQPEVEFILSLLEPGMTFFDIGANAGLFSLAAGKKLAPSELSIYAFEPCPATFRTLQRNLKWNGLTEIRAIRIAISDHAGDATLHVNASLKDGLNCLENPSHTDAEVVSRVAIETTTLDEFVATNQIDRIEVMKVDVEGAELRVFQGAQTLLQRSDAPLILYEGYSWCTAGFHYHPAEIMWLLEEYGYQIFVLDSESGSVRQRSSRDSYDAMIVAAKPSHRSFSVLRQAGESR